MTNKSRRRDSVDAAAKRHQARIAAVKANNPGWEPTSTVTERTPRSNVYTMPRVGEHGRSRSRNLSPSFTSR